MPKQMPVVAITGASGYLGARICSTLESRAWHVIRLVRSTRMNPVKELPYDLANPITHQVREKLRTVDVLIHCAYDLSLTGAIDIWKVNVEGTRRLLEVAKDAGVRRIIVMSSMSAFDGTTQLYGRAKLEIEGMTKEFAGCAVRPGLVYGPESGGMAGALSRLTRLPIVPVMAGQAGVYTVHEDDLMVVIQKLASTQNLPPQTISVAHPSRVALTDVLNFLAAQEDHKCRFIPLPWQFFYWPLRSAELLRLHLPFRADSLLGLVHTTSELHGEDQLTRLNVTLREFPSDLTKRDEH